MQLSASDLEVNLNKAKETLASLPPSPETNPESTTTESASAPATHVDETATHVDETMKAQVLVKYLTDALCFARQLRDAVPIISQLLGSKISSDVTEAIEFFMTASSFQVNNSILGLKISMIYLNFASCSSQACVKCLH